MFKKPKVIILLVLLVVFFFAFRLAKLTLIPVFCDEAIYIRWSQVMRAEQTLRFLPLSDGKQPLFMWLTIPFLKIFSDPLFAGRFLSVLTGFLSLVGIFLLALRLFKSFKIAFFSALFYTVVPYAFFFDRMALVDGFLSALGIWILYFGILLVEYQRLDLAMITGMILGAALITKSPAIFFAVLLPVCLIIRLNEFKKSPFQLVKMSSLFLVVYFFAFVIYNSLRLGASFHMIAIRNRDYIFSLQEVLQHPWDPFQFHIREIGEWFGSLLTWPIFLGAIGSIILGAKNKRILLLFFWCLIPLIIQSFFAKVFTARYLLFAVPPLLIISAWFWEKILKKPLFFILLLLWPIWFDYLLLTNPQKTSLPKRERLGYFEEWTAGYGIKEIADYAREKAKGKNVVIATEGFFGTLPDGLQIYLNHAPGITVFGTGQIDVFQITDSIKNAAQENLAYFVVNESRMKAKDDPNLKLIKEFPKAVRSDGTREKLLFYEVLFNPNND